MSYHVNLPPKSNPVADLIDVLSQHTDRVLSIKVTLLPC
jgi:hypothetical protein